MVRKGKRAVYILGSVIIGLIFVLFVYFVMISIGVIQPRKTDLVIMSSTIQKQYDGSALVGTGYEIVEGKLKDGHHLNVEFTSSITEIGSCDNEINVQVLDLEGADISNRYNLQLEYGKLIVRKRALTIQILNKTKVYDRTPLVVEESDWTVVNGSVLPTDELTVTVQGERTEVGQEQCYMTATLTNMNGQDVSDNYDVRFQGGLLEVTGRPLTIQVGSATKLYDGLPLTAEDYEIVEGGLFENHHLELEYLGSQTEVGASDSTARGVVLDESGNDVTKDYAITYLPGTLEVTTIDLKVYTEDISKTYDGTPLVCEDETKVRFESLLPNHQVTFRFTGSQTNVGECENTVEIVSIVDENGKDVTKAYNINNEFGKLKVQKCRVDIRFQNLRYSYDGMEHFYEDSEENWSISPLGFPNHRVEVHIEEAGLTEVGTKNIKVTSMNVYREDNNEDVSSNFTFPTNLRITLEITKCKIKIKSNDIVSVEYDGTDHKDSKNVEIISSDSPFSDLKIECSFSELTKEVGIFKNEFTINKITNDQGQDITKNFDIESEFGEINITKISLKIVTATLEKEYDGTPLFPEPTDWALVSGRLVDGDKIKGELNAFQQEIGSKDNVLSNLTIGNETTKADHMNHYEVNCEWGKLIVYANDRHQITISPRPIYIDEQDWDKSLIKADKYLQEQYSLNPELTPIIGFGEWLAQGYRIEASIEGELNEVGAVETKITYNTIRVYMGEDDVTSEFSFQTKPSILQIYQYRLRITTPSARKEYDGTPLKTTTEGCSYSITYHGEIYETEDEISYELIGQQTEVGLSYNSVRVTIAGETDFEGERYKLYYIDDSAFGRLEVTRKRVIISSESKTITQEELERDYPTGFVWEKYTIDGVAPDELPQEWDLFDIQITFSPEARLDGVGQTLNEFTVRIILKETGQDVTKNFICFNSFGDLIVEE